jgi:hypothetical protein
LVRKKNLCFVSKRLPLLLRGVANVADVGRWQDFQLV